MCEIDVAGKARGMAGMHEVQRAGSFLIGIE